MQQDSYADSGVADAAAAVGVSSFTARSSAALGELRNTFTEHLYLPDPTSVDFAAAVMIANRMERNDPVWGMIVGPSGGGKTEAVQSTGDLPEVHQLSSLTAKTLLSGKQKKGAPASLLHRMDVANERVLVLKDFTTVLSMRNEDRAEILSQLREVYDGQLKRETGMGDVLEWKGHIGFLAGVTPAIDLHHAVISVLGERFVYLRLPEDTGEEISGAAFDEDAEQQMRVQLRDAMKRFVEGVDVSQVPEPPDDVRAAIILLARRTAWVRSSVPRDGYGSREILQRPSLEAPTRIVKQLRQLWRAAVLMGHEDPPAFVRRVARDSTRPADRLQALRFIAERERASSTEVRRHLRLPYSTNRRILEDLEALGLIEVVEPGDAKESKPNVYSLTDAAMALFPVGKRNSGAPPEKPIPRERREEIQKDGDLGRGSEQGFYSRMVNWPEAG